MLNVAVAQAAEKAEQAAPVRLSEPVGSGQVLQVFLALVLVLGLIVLSAWLMRRYSSMPFGRQGVLRLLASVSVGQRERIVLLQAGETQLLLGVTQSSVRTLHVFDKPVMLAGEAEKDGERFAERLASAIKRHGGEQ
jgi:flagellar protein FliO/FliZ